MHPDRWPGGQYTIPAVIAEAEPELPGEGGGGGVEGIPSGGIPWGKLVDALGRVQIIYQIGKNSMSSLPKIQ
jgi:hypothetical protein